MEALNRNMMSRRARPAEPAIDIALQGVGIRRRVERPWKIRFVVAPLNRHWKHYRRLAKLSSPSNRTWPEPPSAFKALPHESRLRVGRLTSRTPTRSPP